MTMPGAVGGFPGHGEVTRCLVGFGIIVSILACVVALVRRSRESETRSGLACGGASALQSVLAKAVLQEQQQQATHGGLLSPRRNSSSSGGNGGSSARPSALFRRSSSNISASLTVPLSPSGVRRSWSNVSQLVSQLTPPPLLLHSGLSSSALSRGSLSRGSSFSVSFAVPDDEDHPAGEASRSSPLPSPSPRVGSNSSNNGGGSPLKVPPCPAPRVPAQQPQRPRPQSPLVARKLRSCSGLPPTHLTQYSMGHAPRWPCTPSPPSSSYDPPPPEGSQLSRTGSLLLSRMGGDVALAKLMLEQYHYALPPSLGGPASRPASGSALGTSRSCPATSFLLGTWDEQPGP